MLWQSEYVSERSKRREFVSGFTGSAGLALISMNEALLWTDGRYFLQAALELSDQWKLMRMGGGPAVDIWMADTTPPPPAPPPPQSLPRSGNQTTPPSLSPSVLSAKRPRKAPRRYDPSPLPVSRRRSERLCKVPTDLATLHHHVRLALLTKLSR
ncbi:hypothetical protein ACSBR1_020659 [Camellia fascicularis]